MEYFVNQPLGKIEWVLDFKIPVGFNPGMGIGTEFLGYFDPLSGYKFIIPSPVNATASKPIGCQPSTLSIR